MKTKKRILIAVLNWGLGHASRSVPVINELLKQGAEPLIGSDGDALVFLKKEFPNLESVELPSYNVRYKYNNMFLNIAPQLPALINVLTKERRFAEHIIRTQKIQGIISDNRYAVSSAQLPSVFITHQLNIRISNPLVRILINSLNRKYLNKFDKIWVPDTAEDINLTGKLAHGTDFGNLSFIGPLSRLNPDVSANGDYKIVALLSGPEPQRSYLEKKLRIQLIETTIPSLIIRGKFSDEPELRTGTLHIRNFAGSDEIASLIKGAELFIARSGYSTIMDLAKINSGSLLLIPTPGQTEQEYLAARLSEQGAALTQKQTELNVIKAWNERSLSGGLRADFNTDLLSDAVTDFLKMIN